MWWENILALPLQLESFKCEENVKAHNLNLCFQEAKQNKREVGGLLGGLVISSLKFHVLLHV